MTKLLTNAPRGTQDLLPEQVAVWQRVEQKILQIARLYGFSEMRVPTLEHTELFCRSVGDTTDVVQKEMFTFEDRGGRSLSLRPEGTAGMVRAAVQSGLIAQKLPLKVCYLISCFRNERPQAGRYKEFHQFGAEMFGPAGPAADAEIISFAAWLFESFGLKGIRLELNSIGCAECRAKYQQALVDYFSQHSDKLCETCLGRLKTNPLRLLDCKNPDCAQIADNAPEITDYLCSDCAEHFQKVQQLLKQQKISFAINPKMVRGLDYYSKTVFEFVSEDLGAQSALCGGGRYDSLVRTMGGSDVPALGFAIGLERLLLVMQARKHPLLQQPIKCDLYIGTLGEQAIEQAVGLVCRLRAAGFCVETDLMQRSAKAQMKYADKICAKYSCMIGENEAQTGKVAVKQMSTGEQTELLLTEFEQQFSKLCSKSEQD